MSPVTPRRATYTILAVALALRVGFVLTRPDRPEFPDGYRYRSIAGDLLAGEGLKRDRGYRCVWPDDRSHWGTGYLAHFQPGYPVFLAGLELVGLGSPLWIRLAQAALGTLTVWFVMIIALRIFGGRCALAAGAVAACEPFLVFFTGAVLTETPFTFLLTASLVFLVPGRGDGEESAKRAAMLYNAAAWGALGGLAALVRSMFLLFPPLVALVDVVLAPRERRRARILRNAVALVAFCAVLAPWTVRNAIRLGAFAPGSTRVGMSVYAGFAPETTGGWKLEELDWPRDRLAPLGELGRDRLLFRLGVRNAFARPFRSLYLVSGKLGRLWSPVPWAPGYVSAFYWTVGTVAFLGLVGAAAAGAATYRRTWRAWWPVIAPAAYVSLTMAVFPGSLRFRVPAHAGLAVLAGLAYVALWDRLRPGRQRNVSPRRSPQATKARRAN